MTSTSVHYESVEEYLGPGEGRFFGGGFRRVAHRIEDIELNRNVEDGRHVAASGNVLYPREWSRKSPNVDLRPHLTSIDALVLGVHLVELHLGHVAGLDAEQRRRTWLRRFVMKGGSNPQEELTQFPIRARHVETRAQDGSVAGHVSTYDCQIGTIKVRCEIEHERGRTTARPDLAETVASVLGAAGRRYYGEGYKFRRQHVRHLAIEGGARRIGAEVEIELMGEDSEVTQGLEAHYAPSVLMIDSIVSLAQMAQVLLYTLDGIKRAESNTLWMRQVVMESESPMRPPLKPFVASTSIIDSRLLKFSGGLWRASDMVGDFGGISARYSVAHELPDSDERRPA